MNDTTTEADVQELKDNLQTYLERMEAGGTVTITRRGEPIGHLVPAREGEASDREDEKSLREKMQALQEAGLAEWSGKKPPPRDPVVEVKGDQMVSDMLLEDRR